MQDMEAQLEESVTTLVNELVATELERLSQEKQATQSAALSTECESVRAQVPWMLRGGWC